MVLAWYEKLADAKDRVLLEKREFATGLSGTHPPHFHNAIEITVCLEGESEFFVNGKVYSLTGGTVCFANALDIHKYKFGKGTVRYVAVISADELKSVGWEFNTVFPAVVNDAEIFLELKKLFEVAEKNWDPNDKMMKLGFTGMLLATVKKVALSDSVEKNGRYSEVMINMLQYISSNSEKTLTAESVAAHFGYTPNYFSSIFKKNTGVTFKEYLNFCRVVSYQRLRERDERLSVVEAAERCGFGSVKTLYRACKKSRVMQTYYSTAVGDEGIVDFVPKSFLNS